MRSYTGWASAAAIVAMLALAPQAGAQSSGNIQSDDRPSVGMGGQHGMMGLGMMGRGTMPPGMAGGHAMTPGAGHSPVPEAGYGMHAPMAPGYGMPGYGMHGQGHHGMGYMMSPGGYGMPMMHGGYGGMGPCAGHGPMMGPRMMGPGYGMGPGMMMGPSMMGPGMMKAPGMMHGPGMQQRGVDPRGHGGRSGGEITADTVRQILEARLAWRGNPNLKVGEVMQQDDRIVATIVTQDDSLVSRFEIDAETGAWQPAHGG